jgi:Zn-finger protein
MTVKIIESNGTSLKIEVEFKFSRSMLESEEGIQEALNSAGNVASGELLKIFDTDGSPIVIGSIKMTSKGEHGKTYQTPYGEIEIKRHVYQSNEGGSTYCPLESNARIILTSTPRLAKQVSHKMAEMASPQVYADMQENHGRKLARSYLKDLSEAVAAGVQAKEETWEYQTPKIEKEIKTIAIGMDATCMLLCEDGYKQAVVGTIALYDKDGERQHTTYIASTPQAGKSEFKKRFTREIEHVKQSYPNADRIGIADGAKENWLFLAPHVNDQILDFWHATEYLGSVSEGAFPRDKNARELWLSDRCHQLKHEPEAVSKILNELKIFREKKLNEVAHEKLEATITYFTNNQDRMNYSKQVELNRSIGSGPTEAACKMLIKQRLCKSGMKWKEKGAKAILSLRCLVRTTGRWVQFWRKVDQYGLPVAV